MEPKHHIRPTWTGQDCFIICGGTSVVPEQVQRLHGRPNARTIVINTSYQVAPWADVLFFADDRWWKREVKEHAARLDAFTGDILTIARYCTDPRLKVMKQLIPPPGLARDRNILAMERTSLQGALNIAVHKGAGRIILLGADNRDGDNGKAHFHAEYPWVRKPDTWKWKLQQLEAAAKALESLQVPVINASPISTLPWWPKVGFMDWLAAEDMP